MYDSFSSKCSRLRICVSQQSRCSFPFKAGNSRANICFQYSAHRLIDKGSCTPGTQNKDGRDHHPYGFSVWMAGGGIKGGIVHGATDEIGFHAAEDAHYVTDVHATILHQLGLQADRMFIPGHKRLEADFGEVIRPILA